LLFQRILSVTVKSIVVPKNIQHLSPKLIVVQKNTQLFSQE